MLSSRSQDIQNTSLLPTYRVPLQHGFPLSRERRYGQPRFCTSVRMS